MSETIDLKKTIYGKNTFSTVVDTTFKELLPEGDGQGLGSVSIDNFFKMYDTLFMEIPAEGTSSHLELLDRSGDYVGRSYTDLLNEVESLKQENSELKNKIYNLEG